MHKHASRILRQSQNPWEAKFWKIIRNRQIGGFKYRRQFKIGDYIVDFCCLEKRLIIELDGGHHSSKAVSKFDRRRESYLTEQGYKVLRFWNNDLESNLEGIVESILQNS